MNYHRERFQASSSSPSLDRNRGKKAKEPEQSKPFEFAVVYEEPEKEEFVIKNCNILLRGFLLLVSTDSEEEVRRKIRLTGFVPFFEQKNLF